MGNDLNSATELPSFITSGRNFRIVTSDTVVLPCEVTNPGNYVLVWKRGIAVLTAGATKVSPDERIRLVDGYNLEIRDVQTQDAGDYVCQIGTLEPREITHTVEILVPPRIHHVSSGGNMEVKKGASVTLECRASGNPVPTITWTRKNNLLPSGDQSVEGISITIENTNRHHAGVYQCTASNGVGEPVTQEIALHVLYPPEIEVERSWVHSGEGYEAQLVCIVHAEPQADVLWYRDTLRLDTTERRIMEVRGSRHTLILRKVQASDFGNYSCVADNVLGKTRQYLELSGKPNPVTFVSKPVSRFRDRYNISWAVNSYTPIEEYKLSFRKLPIPGPQGQQLLMQQQHQHQQQQHNGRRPARRDNDTYWVDVVLPTKPSEQFHQEMWYFISNLEPGAEYEAKVRAKNRFGWNRDSESFKFTTRGIEMPLYEPSPEPAVFAEPEVRDMGIMAYGPAAEAGDVAMSPLIMAMCVVASAALSS
ncbi:limbic system-associated membrane protein isoform X1 [Schistocerca gregaria]|uniref:limbic system-associated membrane protein isoform X1 n=1 Tax=Schistocerca gregaria TaxID=7010 RepID=UPI00211EE078|nr:limbic system-associated membrane protein isoform X1 [Schistocerca gregaria]